MSHDFAEIQRPNAPGKCLQPVHEQEVAETRRWPPPRWAQGPAGGPSKAFLRMKQ